MDIGVARTPGYSRRTIPAPVAGSYGTRSSPTAQALTFSQNTVSRNFAIPRHSRSFVDERLSFRMGMVPIGGDDTAVRILHHNLHSLVEDPVERKLDRVVAGSPGRLYSGVGLRRNASMQVPVPAC